MTEARRRVAAHGRLVAVDGVNSLAVRNAARVVVATIPADERGGVSVWDASGIFGDLLVAGEEAGQPSARTLLLLYAADLAFRLRWEIRPALEEGKSVVAAPYVATAVSFGKAAGLDANWLANLFAFAPKPAESRAVDAAPERNAAERNGFVELACETVSGGRVATRRDLLARAHATFQTKQRT
jgi:hypothetical protein